MFLIFDTETTGLPKNYRAPISDTENWPRLVQLAWQLHAADGSLINKGNRIIIPEGFDIPFNSTKIHGISTERAHAEGIPLKDALSEFLADVARSTYSVGHNIEFDINIVGCELFRTSMDLGLSSQLSIDTKDESVDHCAIPGGKGGKFKWPTLSELHHKLFDVGFDGAHDAAADVDATARAFFELVRLGVVQRPDIDNASVNAYKSTLSDQPAADQQQTAGEKMASAGDSEELGSAEVQTTDAPFAHLHCHSQFSVLQATPQLDDMISMAMEMGMPAIGLTDHGNLYGSFQFMRSIDKANKEVFAHNKKVAAGEAEGPELPMKIKGIAGCEFNICADHTDRSHMDNGAQVPLLAKDKDGFLNLSLLSSAAFLQGFYYVPRIDKDLLVQHKEGVIALTGGMYGEIPSLILNVGETQAEAAFQWWHEQFGDDFYVELNRHGLEENKVVNDVLLKFARKYGVRIIAANNVYYLNQEDANAHDILLCIKDGEKQATPIGRGRGFRYGFPNDQFYLKSQEEMKTLFADLPEAIENIAHLTDKCSHYTLDRDVLLPKFDIPAEFETEDDYLKHITYEGARERYGEITDEIRERLDFELATIEQSGYPGYFLIVQDFTTQARKMGVSVGPGRGSAAGSAVAYCIGITNVDPIEYDLLFERFLNPDRVSLPDIDIDFDDEGRGSIIDWVVDKYGKDQVAQIITYGSMAAKSAIRDTARVLDFPLPETDKLAKQLPDISLTKLFKLDDAALKEKLAPEELAKAKEFKKIAEGSDERSAVIAQARVLEGSLRNTGIHACGVIITPSDIKRLIPVTKSKDEDLYVTQFDNAVMEDTGLLKMDFLGLKTLTIIKDAIALVKVRHGVDIDPDEIPLDDVPTYELYQRGETNGTFQFESPGMQKHLKALKPDQFSDLIAMNALYRPGPLKYIPDFIARKHGKQEISYDVPEMEEFLAETYGITVYQEQVMRLSQKLAGFTKGDADVLRKAMGKKKREVIDAMRPRFIEGCAERNIPSDKAEKIWTDWEAFAQYAFNKSHSTCYSVVAYHTAYLKANYPSEFMAAVLTHNLSDLKKVTFYMEECRRMGIECLGPDVNESMPKFSVNEQGGIRFALSAIKGVGSTAVEEIIRVRQEGGPFVSIFDLCKRVNLRTVNKKSLEGLALAGAFDSFEGIHRAQYTEPAADGLSLVDRASKHGANCQQLEKSQQNSLFGGVEQSEIPDPQVLPVPEWKMLDQLRREREVVGIYLSGHPLDNYQLEIKSFANCEISALEQASPGRDIRIAGIVTSKRERMSKRGKKFCVFNIEDYGGSTEMAVFGTQFLELDHIIEEGKCLLINGKRQPRYNNEDELEFRIGKIETLEMKKQALLEGKETTIKGIRIDLSLDDIDELLIRQLDELAEEHQGSYGLKLRVLGTEGPYELTYVSRAKRVSINMELIKAVEEMGALSYQLY